MSNSQRLDVSQQSFWMLLATVVHRYATWFVAPFVAVAAFTALLYIATPQLERWYYRDVLMVQPVGQVQPLHLQIVVAQRQLSLQAEITAVRPAPSANSSTHVMFRDPKFPNTTQALFVDPYRLKVLGQYAVYGTSGLLPLRTQLDHWHRDLGLGNWGRWYSELAASWLALLAITGLLRFIFWRQQLQLAVGLAHRPLQQSRRKHALIGLVLLPFLLFFAITGLTWSQYAGQNIFQLRQLLQWQTPSLNTQISNSAMNMTSAQAEHDHHLSLDAGFMHIAPQSFEHALQLARAHGIDAAQVQIKVPAAPNQAWVVQEIGQRWPTQVDSVAIDLSHSQIIDQLYFADYPLVAKLIRWGIDAHIGVLFGVVNQVLLLFFALGLMIAIAWGYRIAYLKQRLQPRFKPFYQKLLQLWQQGSALQCTLLLLLMLLLSIALPLFGLSLMLALGVALWQGLRQWVVTRRG